MTVLGVGVVATIVTGGAAATVTAPALAGLAPGTGLATAVMAGTTTASSAVAGSAGIGATVGAITGAAAGGTGAAAATGAAIGSASSAAVTSTGAFFAAGPVGWVVLGGEQDASSFNATFDCWKQVLRDESTELSRGKLLKEIFEDQRIKQVIVQGSKNNFNLPELSLINIWDEQFDLKYLVLPSNNQLVAHAVRVA
ncbi:fibroin heavy chain-like [Daphnia magna]|uniref:fibroin heavy chain-like n=1 Tax=Daphnia magna TaxID=35525 RepID=UPI00140412C5|nr:fibroin heavy chain-like [Daphnia magna]XP_045023183.1 fibroin heavy chain-like [Daphnia magna]XP_045023184.1 fibroin heavy chain-like [Daphnia magna]